MPTWRHPSPLLILGVLAFAVVAALPYTHAAAPGHSSHHCVGCDLILSGAVMLPALLIIMLDQRVRQQLSPEPVLLRESDRPSPRLPRGPPE